MSSDQLNSFYAVTQEGKRGAHSLWQIRIEEGVNDDEWVVMEKLACSGNTIIPRFVQFRNGTYAAITPHRGVQLFYPSHHDDVRERREHFRSDYPFWCGNTETICALRMEDDPDWYKKSDWRNRWMPEYNYPWEDDNFLSEPSRTVEVLKRIGKNHPHFLVDSILLEKTTGLIKTAAIIRRIVELTMYAGGDLSAVEDQLEKDNADAPTGRWSETRINETLANLCVKLELEKPSWKAVYTTFLECGLLFPPEEGILHGDYLITWDGAGFVVQNAAGNFLIQRMDDAFMNPWQKIHLSLRCLLEWIDDGAFIADIQEGTGNLAVYWEKM